MKGGKQETGERGGPTPGGGGGLLIDRGFTDVSVTGKEVGLGSEYTSTEPYFINGYRVYVVAGNSYEIITVFDPDGANEAQFVNQFTAAVSGWRTFTLAPRTVAGGVSFQLLAIVAEPDPSPTIVNYNYNYQKPTNITAPLVGQISHASKQLGVLSINETDNDAIDRRAFLATLGGGD